MIKNKISDSWTKFSGIVIGFGALVWFLVRVIPKPSRAAYPCQRTAFPLASAFVIWLTGLLGSLLLVEKMRLVMEKRGSAKLLIAFSLTVTLVFWLLIMPTGEETVAAGINRPPEVEGFNWKPGLANQPIGIAKGIKPGRVVWTHDPSATKWSGNWKEKTDQWWTDNNTDQDKVDNMVSLTLKRLTLASTDEDAWDKIFRYYNQKNLGIQRGYQKGEIIAIKANFNSSSFNKTDNVVDASPQMLLAFVRQLVHHAQVPENNIIIYDARRYIYPYALLKIWNEFKDVRFMQEHPAHKDQPYNPHYNTHQGLESAEWIEGITYSAGDYNQAKLIPRQIMEATYLINMAILKLHSYPYKYMEDGDEGQTGVTMCGKNHFGSIKGTSEHHYIINTKRGGVKNAYSPMVDLAASPNLGAKTILYLLDGLYCGRKHKSYPLHFPNPPFNNQSTPYENPEWPSSILASFDGVALESVGIDIFYSQSKNNTEPLYHDVPRIMVRDNASDYLFEMAEPQNAPSGIKYIQNGKPVNSLGVHEHWDNDLTRRYSRNIDPVNGKGIELVYQPLLGDQVKTPDFVRKGKNLSITCGTPNSMIYYTVDGSTPNENSSVFADVVHLRKGMIVKAIATTCDLLNSNVSEFSYK